MQIHQPRPGYNDSSSFKLKVMPPTYDSDCPVARTLNIIGERWTVLILRDFFLRGKALKFNDLQESLAGISPNTLSSRLKALEEYKIIEKRLYEEHPPRAEYFLTARGKELGPVLKALKEWGQKHA